MSKATHDRRLQSVVILSVVVLTIGVAIRFATVSAAPDDSALNRRATEGARRYATERVGLPPEKQGILDIDATRQAGIALTPSRPPSKDVVLADTPVVLTGILPLRENPYNRAQVAENQWHGYLNGRAVGVWAGITHNDAGQGMVGIAIANQSGAKDTYTEYLTPRKAGGVHITEVNGAIVSLLAKDGTTFVFDLQTMAFK